MTDPMDREFEADNSSSIKPDGSDSGGLQTLRRASRERADEPNAVEAAKAAEETARHSGPSSVIIAAVVLVIVAIVVTVFTFGRPHTEGTGALAGVGLLPAGSEGSADGSEASGPGSVQSTSCTIQMIDPRSLEDVPASGPVTLEWTEVPKAADYAVEITQPEGSGPAWVIPVSDESKVIYMENFPAAGEYAVTIKALSNVGDLLCAASFKFTKAASDDPTRKAKEGGETCFDPNNSGTCP